MVDAVERNPRHVAKGSCNTCKTELRVDFELLIRAQGRHYSLVGQHGKCRVLGCPGSVVFLCSNGKQPFFPLNPY